jgi:hypothetical protein
MSASDPIFLFTPYFSASTPERQAEIDACLQRNVESRYLERIFLLVDDGHRPTIKNQKMEIITVRNRPTYREWIELTKNLGASCVSVLANSDIYFDDTLPRMRDVLRSPQAFVALTRHEFRANRLVAHPNPQWSQDVWAIHGSSEVSTALLRSLDVPLGVPRCDNKIAYLFAIQGWNVYNPVNYVNAVHVHQSEQRSYSKKGDLTVIGGVAYVHPMIDGQPSKVEIDVWVKNAPAIIKVKLNKSLDRWENELFTGADEQVEEQDSGIWNGKGVSSVPVDQVKGSADRLCSVAERLTYIRGGDLAFDFMGRFRIYRNLDQLLLLDLLQPEFVVKSPSSVLPTASKTLDKLPDEMLAEFIPPVMDSRPIMVGDRPIDLQDVQFWQYPCLTEKQAFDNHLSVQTGHNFDPHGRAIHTYLGLPWATYVDKKTFPDLVLRYFRPRIKGLNALARHHGYYLSVHTVCQQIHWRRLADHFNDLGITDLHLSHCERTIDPEKEGYRFRVHSWPLFAVNVEDPTRSEGLEIGKPISKKRFLASFIGAHMKHYRSPIRQRLLDVARADGGADILFELEDEWHFNKIVYQEQVKSEAIAAEIQDRHYERTRRYNEILSDSVFSLCPEGAGPNTLRVWESIAVGAIPVIVADDWVPPTLLGKGLRLDDCCLFVESGDIDGLFARLRGIKRREIKARQSACLEIYEQIRRLQTYPISLHSPGDRVAALSQRSN